MILMYHQVSDPVSSPWAVSPARFQRQMEEIRQRKLRVVTLDAYDPCDPKQVVITFDDGYARLAETAAPILKAFGFPFEVFILGGEQTVSADLPWPFATTRDLHTLIAAGAHLQWHTRTHLNLEHVTDPEVLAHELSIPDTLRALDPNGFRWFAYPYGGYGPAAEEAVAPRFAGAVIIGTGKPTNDRFRLQRFAVFEQTSLRYLGLSKGRKLLSALCRFDLPFLMRRGRK